MCIYIYIYIYIIFFPMPRRASALDGSLEVGRFLGLGLLQAVYHDIIC